MAEHGPAQPLKDPRVPADPQEGGQGQPLGDPGRRARHGRRGEGRRQGGLREEEGQKGSKQWEIRSLTFSKS